MPGPKTTPGEVLLRYCPQNRTIVGSHGERPNGFGMTVSFISTMEPRSRCPTPLRINQSIHNPRSNDRVLDFRWRESAPWCHSPAVRSYAKEDLASLYRQRWNAELDIRSVKQTLQMDILRCKSPDLVRKEIWTHVLAYNLIRTIIAQAATEFCR